MAVKIRLSRVGKKGEPFYRIVAIDSRRQRDGISLEVLGTYDGVKGQLVKYEQERIEYWLSQGAIPTDAFKKIQKMHRKDAATASV